VNVILTFIRYSHAWFGHVVVVICKYINSSKSRIEEVPELMASADREPITGVCGRSPQRCPGAGCQGAKPPEAESFQQLVFQIVDIQVDLFLNFVRCSKPWSRTKLEFTHQTVMCCLPFPCLTVYHVISQVTDRISTWISFWRCTARKE